MGNPLLTLPHADARQRVHIRPAGNRFAWSWGPRSAHFHAESAGQALEEALAQLPGEDIVAIVEGRAP